MLQTAQHAGTIPLLIRDFTYVDLPADTVRASLLANHGLWLSPLAVAAAAEGEELRVRIGPLGPLPMLSKTARIRLGDAAALGDALVVPLSWEATGPSGAFPVLHGQLRVSAVGDDMTQITLEGRYAPPLGGIGRRLDTLVLHRVAEASVRSFLERLSRAMTVRVRDMTRSNAHEANGAGPPRE